MSWNCEFPADVNAAADEVNDAFRRAATGRLAGVLRYSVGPLVSRDVIGEQASLN